MTGNVVSENIKWHGGELSEEDRDRCLRQKGGVIWLTGLSGSGKSTLMNILGCLDRPTGGNYYLDGIIP